MTSHEADPAQQIQDGTVSNVGHAAIDQRGIAVIKRLPKLVAVLEDLTGLHSQLQVVQRAYLAELLAEVAGEYRMCSG